MAGLRRLARWPTTPLKLLQPLQPATSRLFTQSSQHLSAPAPLLNDPSGFGFIRSNPRPPKPRSTGVTEIRGTYYSAYGRRHLEDLLETMGTHIDGIKFAGGSFSLFPEKALREMIDISHAAGVYVSTGGFIEHLLMHPDVFGVVDKYLKKCKNLGFDVVELSAGFLSFPAADWLRLIELVQSHGLKPKPELGIQFGAGGDTEASALEESGTSDPTKIVSLGKQFIDAGVDKIMIESEGITENVATWRTDVIQKILSGLPMDKVMFEAAEPKVFNWYLREFGVDVNLFVDHSQIVQLTCLRTGIWGMADTFGRIASFRN